MNLKELFHQIKQGFLLSQEVGIETSVYAYIILILLIDVAYNFYTILSQL